MSETLTQSNSSAGPQAAQDGSLALEVQGLSKTFFIGFFRKRVEAVRSVSFSVRKGEIFGLLGPNGAGKTTAIKVAMGLIRPTCGEVKIFGEDGRRPHARSHVGYLPENPYFHEYLTPQELLDFYGQLAGPSEPPTRIS